MDEREEVDVLGPPDLVHFHKLDPHLPRNGIKAAEPDGSSEQAMHLSRIQGQQREMMDEKRVTKFGSLSIGDWNRDLELIEIKSEKGKFWQTMGYSANGHKYLYPEEGLFLLEMNAFEIRYQGLPLSLQQAYELLIPKEFSLEEYQTYAYLMRLGYIVTRHKQCEVTEYEHRIKLYKQNSNRRQRARKKVQVWVDQIAKKIKLSNNSDSGGDPTDESYYSSSSGNGFSVNSAGDLNSKVKQAEQDLEDDILLSRAAEDESDEYSSFYSDGPVSQLSPDNRKKIDSDFTYSVVNLLDYNQGHCISGSEQQNHKALKRKHSSWYMTSIDASTSGNSVHQLTPAKVRKESCDGSTEFTKGQERNFLAQIKEEGDFRNGSFQKGTRTKLQSSDLGTSGPSLYDSSVDFDQFLLTVVKEIKHVKKCQQTKTLNRPYSTWNFTKLRIPDMAFGSLDPKFTDLYVKTPNLKGRENKVLSDNFHRKDTGVGGSTTSHNDRDRDMSISSLLDKGDRLQKDSLAAPSNWMEYKALMKKSEKDLSDLLVSPVGHLWSGEVKPLVKPLDAVNTEALLNKLQVIQSAEVREMSRSSCKDTKITFDVYLPDSCYKKTYPGKAAFHIVVYSIHDPVPDFSSQMSILHQTGTIPVLFSVVENADVTFCCFRDVKIPVDVS